MERGIFVTVCLLYHYVSPSIIFFWQAFIHWGFLAAGAGLCWKSNTVIHSGAVFAFFSVYTQAAGTFRKRVYFLLWVNRHHVDVEGGNTWCRAKTETYRSVFELAEPSHRRLCYFGFCASSASRAHVDWCGEIFLLYLLNSFLHALLGAAVAVAS